MISKLIFLIFAAVASWQDLKHRGVNVFIFLLFALLGVATGFIYGRFPSCLIGTLAGLGLLVISHFTDGSLGKGDGLFFVVSGLFLPRAQNFLMLALSIISSGIFSLFVLTVRRIRCGCDEGKDTFPFIPFAAASGLIMCLAEF